jgi:hypothetical protein
VTVSYAQLREARPHKWQEAADEWESLAHYALTKDSRRARPTTPRSSRA